MKNLIFILLTFFSLISCGRDNEEEKDNSLWLGKWSWVSSSGGITGTTLTPASTSKTIVLTLNSDNTFSISTNGVTTSRGTYSLHKDVSNLTHYEATFIQFSGNSTRSTIANENDQLILSDDANDGFTSLYQSQK